MDIYKLAQKFAKETSPEPDPILKIAAGRKHRKQLEKDLAYAKEIYKKHLQNLTGHERSYADLGAVIDKEKKQVDKYKAEMLKCYDVLKAMDLNDVAEVRFHSNGDVGYVKNNRLYKLQDGELVPYKRKRQIDEEFEEADTPEDELNADDLFNTLMSD